MAPIPSETPKAYAFIGASTGCGLAALTAALETEVHCTALLRTPSKLSNLASQYSENLHIKPGNAHNVTDVEACLVHPADGARLVDAVCFSIGGKFDSKTWGFEDKDVCAKGVETLLQALAGLRKMGLTGDVLIVGVSSTGIAKQRDYALPLWPLYHFLLGTPHADKKRMEDKFKASGERVVLVRPSLLVDNGTGAVREGVEDLGSGRVESEAVGFRISRGDVGVWIWKRLLREGGGGFGGKGVTVTW